MNQVNLTGRLSKDVELRYTQSGKAVASGSIAVNRRFKSEGQPDADFINFVMWGKPAESFVNFTHKGSLVGMGGEWQTRNYENNSGQRVYVNELKATSFDLLEPKGGATKQPTRMNNADPFANIDNSKMEFDDSQLPF